MGFIDLLIGLGSNIIILYIDMYFLIDLINGIFTVY